MGKYQKEYLLEISQEKFAAALRDEIQVKDFFHRLSLLDSNNVRICTEKYCYNL